MRVFTWHVAKQVACGEMLKTRCNGSYSHCVEHHCAKGAFSSVSRSLNCHVYSGDRCDVRLLPSRPHCAETEWRTSRDAQASLVLSRCDMQHSSTLCFCFRRVMFDFNCVTFNLSMSYRII